MSNSYDRASLCQHDVLTALRTQERKGNRLSQVVRTHQKFQASKSKERSFAMVMAFTFPIARHNSNLLLQPAYLPQSSKSAFDSADPLANPRKWPLAHAT